MQRRGMFSAFSLKLMMAALMLLDHLYSFLPAKGFPIWFTCLGRLVAPTFCFLMTQSLVHTRDRRRFIGRMALAGAVMWAGSFALMTLVRLVSGRTVPLSNSIFLSLALGAATVDTLERYLAGRNPVCLGGLALCAALSFLVEGMFLIPALAVIFYFLRERKALLCAVYGLAGSLAVFLLCLCSGPFSARFLLTVGGLTFPTQYLQVFALLPILLYNGKPGPQNAFSKWFFYLFYPLHVWALYLLAALG